MGVTVRHGLEPKPSVLFKEIDDDGYAPYPLTQKIVILKGMNLSPERQSEG